MVNLDEIFQFDPEGWLDALPNYQKDIVSAIIREPSHPDEAVMTWLSSFPPGTEPFGGENDVSWRAVYSNKVLDEIEALLCGAPQYKSEREKLTNASTQSAIVSIISIAIGHVLGASAVFIAPIIVVFLISSNKIAVNAWCALRKEKHEKSTSQVNG